MPLYISVAMIREGNRIFTHLYALVAKTQDDAIEKAKLDLAMHHGTKELMGASISEIDPKAIREAYAELPIQFNGSGTT